MSKKLTKDEANIILIESGYFKGLQRLIKEYDLPKEKAAKIKAGLYKHILLKVAEAKTEAARLPSSIMRMEAACRAGMIVKPHLGHEPFGADYNALTAALKPFDGWTISLLETSVSLLSAVHTPDTAGHRVKSLQGSFYDLWNLRMPGLAPFDNFPEVFDLYVPR